MTLPSGMDLMSSPDPLNDDIPTSVVPLTRRMTRSQSTQRFATLQSSSPRKQTFQLDVGNYISPQRLLVTVEAEGGENEPVSRRLFATRQTPRSVSGSRRRERTTTTTVPLKGLDDTSMATPKRRGRPPKSGTPAATSKKRAAGTPIKRTPRPSRKANPDFSDAESLVGTSADGPTPRPTGAKVRKTPARRARSPVKKDVPVAQEQQSTAAKRRGRPRRQALAPEEAEALTNRQSPSQTSPEGEYHREQATHLEDEDGAPSEDDARPEDSMLSSIVVSDDGTAAVHDDADDDDIWLATADPSKPTNDWTAPVNSTSPAPRSGQENRPVVISDDSSDVISEDNQEGYMDMGFAGDRSDAESQASEDVAPSDAPSDAPSEADRDTIAHGEDFSMIMMDSVMSFHAHLDAPMSDLPEMGEATSFIVDRALESLRRSRLEEDKEENPGRGEQGQKAAQGAPSAEGEAGRVFSSPRRRISEATPKASSAQGSTSLLVPGSGGSNATSKSPRRGKATTPLSRQLAIKSLQKDESFMSTPLASWLNAEDSTKQAREETSMYDDSFSEIPEAVLAAATPRPLRQQQQQLSSDEDDGPGHPQSDHRQDVDAMDFEPTLPKSAGSSATRQTAPAMLAPHSETGSRLLTPDETPPNSDDNPAQKETAEGELEAEQEEQVEHEIHDDTVMAEDEPEDYPEEDPEDAPHLHSSPPLPRSGSQTAETSRILRRWRRSSETPQPTFSSPQAPPAMEDAEGHLTLPSLVTARPALSPVVRVGRALQSVTSDPPSPVAGDKALGSPFRSSVVRDAPPSPTPQASHSPQAQPTSANSDAPPLVPPPAPSSAAKTSMSWTKALNPLSQIKNLVSQGAQMFSSPRFSNPPTTALDDPFAPDLDMPTPKAPSFRLAHGRSLSLASSGQEGPAAASTASSASAAAQSDDGMDWEPAGSPSRSSGRRTRSESLSSVVATQGSRDSSLRSKQGSHVNEDHSVEAGAESEVQFGVPAGISAGKDDEEEFEQDEEDDEDIWAIEAQRPTPSPTKSRKTREEEFLAPRRSKLPSPWTRRTRSGSQSPHKQPTQPMPSPDGVRLAPEPSSSHQAAEEFSLLSLQGRDEPPVKPPVADPKPQMQAPPAFSRRVDLSSFFSSPAVVPESNTNSVFNSSSVQRPSSGNPRLSSIPQKAFEPARSRHRGRGNDLFSSAAASPARSPSRNQTPPQQEPETGDAPRPTSASPEHSPQPVFAPVPQKRNFTPRAGGKSGNNSLFGPAPSPSRRTASLENPTPFAAGYDGGSDGIFKDSQPNNDVFTSSSSPPREEDSSFIAPVLKPLPNRAASPSKSCLRSPLKPKTPGRVVEFTSSTLSPLAQAEARHQQLAQSQGQDGVDEDEDEGNTENVGVGMDMGVRKFALVDDTDKENTGRSSPSRPLRSSVMAASPQKKPGRTPPLMMSTRSRQASTSAAASAASSPGTTTATSSPGTVLSRTQWTRAHWVRLDLLLQERRKGSLNFQLQHRVPIAQKRRSASLVGKHVSAQGEMLELEQWHLDVIDAFRAELLVGGDAWGGGEQVLLQECAWDEHTLAKRLFALLVGEERRRSGAYSGAATVLPSGGGMSVPSSPFGFSRYGAYQN